MKNPTRNLSDRTRKPCFAMVAVVCFAMAFPGQAQIVTLSDNGSIALIDSASQAGMFTWRLGDINQLAQQWFWYRVGPSGPESSIDTISAPSITQTVPYQATTRYGNATLSVEVAYLLTGNPSAASSTLSETITIANNQTQGALDLHFFQYMDLDLAGTTGNQSVALNASLARAKQTMLNSSGFAVETAIQNPSHREAGLFPQTLNRLNDGLATTLNDSLTAGPGDATFAFQWDVTINPGSSFQISKIVTVPEPSAVVLLALGLVAFGFRRSAARV
jgi:hypothetical protein